MRISDWSSDVCSSDLQRLLRSVESGQIPISVAVEIAEADDQGIQQALQRAYETNLLRGRKLLIAKKIVEQRRRQGKGLRIHADSHGRGLSADAQLGRASCKEQGCPSVKILVVGVSKK